MEMRLRGNERRNHEPLGNALGRRRQLVIPELVQTRLGRPDLGAEHVGDRLRALADAEQRQVVFDAVADPAVLLA